MPGRAPATTSEDSGGVSPASGEGCALFPLKHFSGILISNAQLAREPKLVLAVWPATRSQERSPGQVGVDAAMEVDDMDENYAPTAAAAKASSQVPPRCLGPPPADLAARFRGPLAMVS